MPGCPTYSGPRHEAVPDAGDIDAERTEDVVAIQLFHGIYGVGMHECRFSLVSLLLFLHHTQGHRLHI